MESGTRMRTVIYLAPSSGLGGAEIFLEQTARHHDRARIRPVYCLFRDGWLAGALRSHGVEVLIAPKAPRLSRPWEVAIAVQWLRASIRESGADLVHSTMAYGAIFGAPAARAENVPHVWYQHGPVTGWMDRVSGVLPAERVFVNSEFTRRAQGDLYGMAGKFLEKARPSEVVRIGADWDDGGASTRSDLRAEWGLGQGDFVAGLIARFQPQKGIELFIEAVSRARARLTSRDCSDVRGVVIGGGDPDYERKLKGLAAREGGAVEFAKLDGRALRAFSALDAVVCSSISPEGYGLTLVEAMAAGRVPVAPREGGPQEIIDEGRTGMFFAPRSAEDLSRVLLYLAENPAASDQLARAAQSRARRDWDTSRLIAKLEEKYSEIWSQAST